MNYCGSELEVIRKKVSMLTLRIRLDGSSRLTVPLHLPEKYIRIFLDKKESWFKRQYAAVARRNSCNRIKFNDNIVVRVFDDVYSLEVTTGPAALHVSDNKIVIYAIEISEAENYLNNWKCDVAKVHLPLIFDRQWQRLRHFFPNRTKPAVTVRNAASRWGSYSSKTHRVMLSSKLASFPSLVAEFIAAHELCHLVERGHGAGFYRLLDIVMPDWRERKKYLMHTNIFEN